MNTFFPAAACAQLQIVLGESAANLAALEGLLTANPIKAETIVVLPEMWATGFAYDRVDSFARDTPKTLAALTELARRYQLYFAGSLTGTLPDNGLPHNVMYLVGPQGVLDCAAKQHLFSLWKEDLYYAPGEEKVFLTSPHGEVGTLVCYDLRFPEQARVQAFSGCKLLLVSAEWPLTRLEHWRALLQARAIENQVFVVAANGCGKTGEMHLAGHSMIIGPDGQILAEAEESDTLIQAPLAISELTALRSRFCPPGERPWRGDDEHKVCDLSSLLQRLAAIRQQGSRIAFTNGCFDLVHAGHVRYLQEARRSGDCLVVGLNSDSSVRRQNKSPDRPINTQEDRARVLAALGCVDFVVIFDETTPLSLINAIKPAILVKGADWAEEAIVGAAEVKEAGGEILRIPLTEGRSTTKIIAHIQKSATV